MTKDDLDNILALARKQWWIRLSLEAHWYINPYKQSGVPSLNGRINVMTSEPCISLGQQDEQIYGKEVSRANRITKRNVLEQEILIEILLPRDNFRHHSHRVATHHSAKDSGLV